MLGAETRDYAANPAEVGGAGPLPTILAGEVGWGVAPANPGRIRPHHFSLQRLALVAAGPARDALRPAWIPERMAAQLSWMRSPQGVFSWPLTSQTTG